MKISEIKGSSRKVIRTCQDLFRKFLMHPGDPTKIDELNDYLQSLDNETDEFVRREVSLIEDYLGKEIMRILSK
jgi:hypothetical protein